MQPGSRSLTESSLDITNKMEDRQPNDDTGTATAVPAGKQTHFLTRPPPPSSLPAPFTTINMLQATPDDWFTRTLVIFPVSQLLDWHPTARPPVLLPPWAGTRTNPPRSGPRTNPPRPLPLLSWPRTTRWPIPGHRHQAATVHKQPCWPTGPLGRQPRALLPPRATAARQQTQLSEATETLCAAHGPTVLIDSGHSWLPKAP